MSFVLQISQRPRVVSGECEEKIEMKKVFYFYARYSSARELNEEKKSRLYRADRILKNVTRAFHENRKVAGCENWGLS